jgi:hypothetical protein
MSESTRRGFLKIAGAGAAGAAAVAATAVVRPGGGEPAAATGRSGTALPAGASGPLVAYVRDVRAAEISVLVDETEVVVQDRELVARLAGARTSRDT